MAPPHAGRESCPTCNRSMERDRKRMLPKPKGEHGAERVPVRAVVKRVHGLRRALGMV